MKLLLLCTAFASVAFLGSAQKKSQLLKCDCSTIQSFTNDFRSTINNTITTILENPKTHDDVRMSLDKIAVSLHVEKTKELLPAVVDTVSTLLTRTNEDNLGVSINTFDVLMQLLPGITATEAQGDSALQIVTYLLRIIVNMFITRLDVSIVNFSVVNGVVMSGRDPVASPTILNLLRNSQLPQLNSLGSVLLGNLFDIGTPLLPPVNDVLSLLDGAAGGGLTSTSGGLLMALTGLVGNFQNLMDSNSQVNFLPDPSMQWGSSIGIDLNSLQSITQTNEQSVETVTTYRINLTALPAILTSLVSVINNSTQSDPSNEINSTVTDIQDLLRRFTQDQTDSISGTELAQKLVDLITLLKKNNDPALADVLEDLNAAVVPEDQDGSLSITTTPSPVNTPPLLGRTSSLVLTLTKTTNDTQVSQIKKEINIDDLERVLDSILAVLNPNATAPLAHRRIRINIQTLKDLLLKIASENYEQKDVLSFVNLIISIFNSVTGQKDPRFAKALTELKTMLPVFPSDEPTESAAPTTPFAATEVTTFIFPTTSVPLVTQGQKVTLSPIEVNGKRTKTVVVGSHHCHVPVYTVVRRMGDHLVEDLRSLTELLSNLDDEVDPKAAKLVYQLIYLLQRVTSKKITDTSLLNHVVDILVVTMKLKNNAGKNTNIRSIVDLLFTKLRSILAIFTSSNDGIIGSISLTTTVIQTLFNGDRLSVESAVRLLRQMCFTGRVGNAWNIVYVLIQLLEKLAPSVKDLNPNLVALGRKVIDGLKDLSPTSTTPKGEALLNLTSTLQEYVGAISTSGLTSTQANSLNGVAKLVLSILLRMIRTHGDNTLQNLMSGIQVNSNGDCEGVLAAVGCLMYDILSKNGSKVGKLVVHVANNNATATQI